ncbi:MAG TPA: GNAT family N-acetyltransferase [Candidatus Baltobacteraceae bacterium]|nr:GNAT family N-acetyltransferase [Candidatus Baltobacteraceae bacterium]
MLTLRTDDLPAFQMLALAYEEELPVELRHADVDFVPDAALVALHDGTPCGCVALSTHDATTAVMKRLYVLPAYRKLGVARMLVDTLIDIARERGFARIVLDTDREQLAPAYRLYRSCGFVECAPYGPVDYATPTFMELALSGTPQRVE